MSLYEYNRLIKNDKHWKTVKEFDLDKSVLLKVLVVSAKYLNPYCQISIFPQIDIWQGT